MKNKSRNLFSGKKRKKLIAFLNSYSQAISGGDAYFIEVAKRMDEFEKIVVTSLLGKKLCQAKGLKADYLITTKEKSFKNVILTYVKRIIKVFLFRFTIDDETILYATSDFLPDVLPAFYQKMRNKKVFWVQKTFHLIPANRFIPHNAQKISFFIIKRFADLTIVDSRLLKDALIQYGFDTEKIAVNFPGVDASYFKNIKSLETTAYDAVFLGRYHLSKGIFDLVDIWKHVCRIKPAAKLAVIGGGNKQIRKKLMKKIAGAGIVENIEVLGYLEDDEAIKILKSSKVFIFPSREEGFGIAALEAMACGLPVVSWDLPVYREVFPKGIKRIAIGDFEGFSRSIIKLLGDERLRKKLSEEAVEISKRYEWDKVAERELALLKNSSSEADYAKPQAFNL